MFKESSAVRVTVAGIVNASAADALFSEIDPAGAWDAR
jgi:hypothetical protein